MRVARVAKNLSLEPDAIERGERYAKRQGKNLSQLVSDLLQVLSVVPLAGPDFQRTLSLGLRDYEDAVQVAACLQMGAGYLVTRNAKDLKGAPVTARAPGEVLALLR